MTENRIFPLSTKFPDNQESLACLFIREILSSRKLVRKCPLKWQKTFGWWLNKFSLQLIADKLIFPFEI